jgi:hypothetical protein
MSLAFNGSSDFARTTTGVVTAVPFSVSIWLNPQRLATAQRHWSACASAQASTHFFTLGQDTTDHLFIGANDGASSTGGSTSTLTLGAWTHHGGIFNTTTNRRNFFNGAAQGVSGVARTPAGIDRMSLGVQDCGTPTNFTQAYLAWLVMWNIDIGDAAMAALAARCDPRRIFPQNIIAFCPYLEVGSPIQDWTKRTAFARTGTAANASVPPLMHAA